MLLTLKAWCGISIGCRCWEIDVWLLESFASWRVMCINDVCWIFRICVSTTSTQPPFLWSEFGLASLVADVIYKWLLRGLILISRLLEKCLPGFLISWLLITASYFRPLENCLPWFFPCPPWRYLGWEVCSKSMGETLLDYRGSEALKLSISFRLRTHSPCLSWDYIFSWLRMTC